MRRKGVECPTHAHAGSGDAKRVGQGDRHIAPLFAAGIAHAPFDADPGVFARTHGAG
jgi:hypothetical protein